MSADLNQNDYQQHYWNGNTHKKRHQILIFDINYENMKTFFPLPTPLHTISWWVYGILRIQYIREICTVNVVKSACNKSI
jgi:hypothetical protein